MKESDLLPGDILFTMNSLGAADHIAIYSGFREGTHFITHAVSEKYHSVMTTRLNPDEIPYQVYRPKDTALALQVERRMRIWCEHQIPYSDEKRALFEAIGDAKGFCHPKNGGKAQCELAQKHFAKNFYRYIEFAAHPDMPFFPRGDASQEGLICSEALVTAFTIEQLIRINAVKSCVELDAPWVTDNIDEKSLQFFITKLSADIKISERYLQYFKSSHSADEYGFSSLKLNLVQEQVPYLPSLFAWRYDKYGLIENFVDLNTDKFVFPLDAKIASPWSMYHFCQNSPQHWIHCGPLMVAEKKYPLENIEQDKAAWRAYVINLFQVAQEKQALVRSKALSPVDWVGKTSIPEKIKRKRRASTCDSPRSEKESFSKLFSDSPNRKAILYGTPVKFRMLKEKEKEEAKESGLAPKPKKCMRALFSFDDVDEVMKVGGLSLGN